MPKTTKTGNKKARKAGTLGSTSVQVQLYLQPDQVRAFDEDCALHEREVQKLMGSGRTVSRSAHGGSLIANYLRCRAQVPDLTYAEFWEAFEEVVKSRKKRSKR